MDGCIVVAKLGYWPLFEEEDWNKCMENVDWDHVSERAVANGVAFCPRGLFATIGDYTPYVFLAMLHVEDLGIEQIPVLQCLMHMIERVTGGVSELSYLDLNREIGVIVAWAVKPRVAVRLAEKILDDYTAPTVAAITRYPDELAAILQALGLTW